NQILKTIGRDTDRSEPELCRARNSVWAGGRKTDKSELPLPAESCCCAANVGRQDSSTSTGNLLCPLYVCAVTRRRFPVGASPTRRTLQPEATGAVMEA